MNKTLGKLECWMFLHAAPAQSGRIKTNLTYKDYFSPECFITEMLNSDIATKENDICIRFSIPIRRMWRISEGGLFSCWASHSCRTSLLWSPAHWEIAPALSLLFIKGLVWTLWAVIWMLWVSVKTQAESECPSWWWAVVLRIQLSRHALLCCNVMIEYWLKTSNLDQFWEGRQSPVVPDYISYLLE